MVPSLSEQENVRVSWAGADMSVVIKQIRREERGETASVSTVDSNISAVKTFLVSDRRNDFNI